tara:strand:+ start:4180 stop:5058 length:879 start_codon:yes stop_codon:yes gene_type:complete
LRSIDRKPKDKNTYQAVTRIDQKINDLELEIKKRTSQLNSNNERGIEERSGGSIEVGEIDIVPSSFPNNRATTSFNRSKLFTKESDGNLYYQTVQGVEHQLTNAIKTNTILKEKGSETGLADYGILWVKNSTPNELYFTNDAGTSYLISNGSGTILSSQYHNPSSESTYSLTTSFTNIDSTNAKITFTGPSSLRVLIEAQLFLEEGSTATTVYLGLSNNSTYATVGASYEKNVGYGRNRKKIINCKWVVSTVSGTSYTYYIGAKASSANGTFKWGGTSSLDNPPLIITATAL